MAAVVGRRIVDALLVLLIVSAATFFLLQLSGDPVQLLVDPTTPPAEREALRHELGFDRPVYEQYGRYLANVARGDLGRSIRYGSPALAIAIERMPASVELALAAMILAVVLAIPAGVVSALYR